MAVSRKPAGSTVNPRNGRRYELDANARTSVPEIVRDRFHPVTLVIWDAYWADPAATTQTPADLMWALVWVEALDDARRKRAEADKQPLVEGSMGQLIANPLYAVANQAAAAAERAARQMGIGAKNRADLGMALTLEQKSLDQVNATYSQRIVEWDPEADGDDPRVAGV